MGNALSAVIRPRPNTFIDIVSAVYSCRNLVYVAGDISGELINLVKLVLVHVNDIALKDHRSYKSAQTAHAAVLKLLLDSVHFCLTHSYLQVQITLVFVFHLFSFPFSVFSQFGVVGATPSAKHLYHVKVAVRAHMIPSLLGVICPCGSSSHFRAFQLEFFLAYREWELCDFFCFSIIVATAIPHIHYTKDFKIRQWLSEKFFRQSEAASSK